MGDIYNLRYVPRAFLGIEDYKAEKILAFTLYKYRALKMFGRQPQKNQPQDKIDLELEDVNFSGQTSTSIEETQQQATVLQNKPDAEKSELVNTVEKISRIVSPYFIVVVGLSLYEKNFLLGTILILLGILSLLKITPKDVATFFEWSKSFLGLNNS